MSMVLLTSSISIEQTHLAVIIYIRICTVLNFSKQDFMLIPELAVNPLGTRIIEAFFTDE